MGLIIIRFINEKFDITFYIGTKRIFFSILINMRIILLNVYNFKSYDPCTFIFYFMYIKRFRKYVYPMFIKDV